MIKRMNIDGDYFFEDNHYRIAYQVCFDYIVFDTSLLKEEIIAHIQCCFEWYPYCLYIQTKKERINNPKPLPIVKMELEDIYVEQLTINEDKLNQVSRWIKEPRDVVVSLVKIDSIYVCNDGYSRLMRAYQLGYPYVYGFIEEANDFVYTCRTKEMKKEKAQEYLRKKYVSHIDMLSVLEAGASIVQSDLQGVMLKTMDQMYMLSCEDEQLAKAWIADIE